MAGRPVLHSVVTIFPWSRRWLTWRTFGSTSTPSVIRRIPRRASNHNPQEMANGPSRVSCFSREREKFFLRFTHDPPLRSFSHSSRVDGERTDSAVASQSLAAGRRSVACKLQVFLFSPSSVFPVLSRRQGPLVRAYTAKYRQGIFRRPRSMDVVISVSNLKRTNVMNEVYPKPGDLILVERSEWFAIQDGEFLRVCEEPDWVISGRDIYVAPRLPRSRRVAPSFAAR